VQTTLLSFAIAMILALVAALVGPVFIDWNSYRAELETRASHLTGLDFRVTGSIDARLLPTPTLVLQGIELGRRGMVGNMRAQALRVEFALGALVRGEWRIADARLEEPEFAAGLDEHGRLAWPIPKFGFDLEGVSIDRLRIEGGRATLSDAASGSSLVVDQLEFRGELRSLAGPIKGEGSFRSAGQHFPYRFSSSRVAEDGSVKLRLAVDPADRPVAAEVDVSISMDRGMPRFEGAIQLARLVSRAPVGAQSLIIEPWRVTSRIKGDSFAAVLEQLDFQYGPDDRPIKLRGNARVTFGAQPEIEGVLSSPQIDLDRFLEMPEAVRRRPMAAIKLLAETFTAAVRVPIPATLSIGVEAVTLGGATLARVGADLKGDGRGLDITTLEFRAPGVTHVRLSGQLGATAGGVSFDGSTLVESNDPRALLAWLMHRTEPQTVAAGYLRLGGEVSINNDAFNVERLKLELDRTVMAGRLAYTRASEGRPARLDAAITTPEIDLDRAHAVAKSLLGEATMEWPGEGTLSLNIARALIAGTEAKHTDVQMRIGAEGLEIEQLAVADFGGAALAVKGRIDAGATSRRGALTLDLEARSLDGALTLMDKIAPQVSEELRRSAQRLTPLTLRASVALEPGKAAGAESIAKLKLEGRSGAFRIALQGDSNVPSDALKIDNLGALGAAKVNLTGRLEGDDAGALVELVGLDRHLSVEQRPARLALTARGPLNGELAIAAQLVAGALDISTNGKIRVFDSADRSANLDLKVTNAHIRSLRPAPAGRPTDFVPASIKARLTFAAGTLHLADLKGTVAGTSVGGRLSIGVQQPFTLDGDIELGTLDLPALIATVIGIPAQQGSGAGSTASGLWPAEPFEQTPHRLKGQVVLRSGRAVLTPKLAARDFRSLLLFGETELSLQTIEGTIAGGRVGGELTLLRQAEGLTARARVKLTGANAAELVPGGGVLSGRMSLEVAAEGSGMSATALIGSLAGNGTFLLENAKLARLDPSAFNAVIRAVDQGLPIDPTRMRDKTDAALAAGGLMVPLAAGQFTIDAGQARMSSMAVRAQGADLTVGGSVNLVDSEIDTRLTLSGTAAAPAGTRPEIGIALKGPIEAPKRTTDVAMLASWLAMRAVEQQAKKLDVLEGRAPAAQPGSTASDAVEAVRPAPAAAGSGPPSPARGAPEGSRPRPMVRSKARPTTQSEQAQQPPPIDIRPAPAPRVAPRSAGSQGAAGQSQGRPQTAAPPSRPRSLSEILFGN
jgi:large subunit ribosomal protein L24